ncbi:MAG: hypothetical protein J7L38_02965 [Thermoproteales archaeon]|nr:hypothetical protein [Thermoproteales archaeon]RLE63027.1 MAG: hypothetical protein DRJ47_09860 [Thermoprotei archaeon]
MPTTITISYETKRLLDSLRENRTWDEFLRELALRYKRNKIKKALEELRKTSHNRDIPYSKTRLRLNLG